MLEAVLAYVGFALMAVWPLLQTIYMIRGRTARLGLLPIKILLLGLCFVEAAYALEGSVALVIGGGFNIGVVVLLVFARRRQASSPFLKGE